MFVAVSLEQIRLDHIYAFVGSVQVVLISEQLRYQNHMQAIYVTWEQV